MINMQKWISDILESDKRIAIPIMTNPGIELCNYKIIEAVTDGQKHFEAIKKLNDTYPAGASTVIMDLTVEAEAFGAQINFPEDEVPAVIGCLLPGTESIEKLEVPGLEKGRISEYLKANELTAGSIQDKPVLAGCIGPFSLAGRLFGMTEIMIAIYTDPEAIHLLLEKCTQFLSLYCKAIKKTGVNGVVMAEPAAGLISNSDCSAFSSAYITRIVEELQDDNFIIVLHNCGNTGHCTPAMIETKAAALHFGNKIDVSEALKECPADILVMGNLDPVGVFRMSTPDEVKEATLDLLQKTSGYKNFVLSSGCDIPPHVPFENIDAFYDALKQFNQST